MPFPTLIEQIQHMLRKSYTRYEIDRDLLCFGYDPAEIDAAWQVINFPARPVKLISTPRFWLIFAGYVVGIILIFFLLNFMFPGTGTGFLVILSLWLISSVGVKFLEKRDKCVSKGLLYGAVVVGCAMYGGTLFMWFYNILLALQNCRGGCYP